MIDLTNENKGGKNAAVSENEVPLACLARSLVNYGGTTLCLHLKSLILAMSHSLVKSSQMSPVWARSTELHGDSKLE
jgi:hypothetical protein